MRWLWAWQATRPLATAVGPPLAQGTRWSAWSHATGASQSGTSQRPRARTTSTLAQVAGEAPHRPAQVEDLAVAVEDDAAQHAPHDGGHGQAGMHRGPVEQLAPPVHRGVVQRQTGRIEPGGW